MRNQSENHKGSSHREWHSRGYIPHFDHAGTIQGVTFRLADSLPKEKRHLLDKQSGGARRRVAESLLNTGLGRCWLKDARIAEIVEGALLHFDEQRYRLLAWVIMPNHVHVVIEQIEGWPLGEVVKSWKSFTARQANALLGRSGAFWSKDYFDRYVRDADQIDKTITYVHENPVKAGLAKSAEDWRWSSAHGLRSRQTEMRTHADGSF